MDHSWRPRSQPPIQGDICPMCFVSHFPFCPPHPEFNQNPRFQFQPHDDHFFQRPPLDPYYDHRGPAMRPHPPFVDLFGDLPRPWHRNPSLERDPHGNSSSSYDSVGFKRMRVDEVGPGLGPPVYDSFVNSPRVSAQDERRLKLIRDHGAAQNEPLDVGVIKGHDQESGIFRGSLSFYHGKSLNFDESQNNNGLKPLSSHEVYNFYEAGFSDFDRKSTTFHHKPGFNQEEHSSTFGQQSMQTNSIEERLQSRYGQTENNFQKSGRTGYSVGNFTSVEQAGQTRDLAASYGTNLGDRYSPVPHKGDMNPPSNMPQRVPFPIYEAHSQIHPSEPASSKESPFSHPTNWQRMSDSEATYHENNNNFSLGIHNLNNHRSHPYAVHHNIGQKDDLHSHEEPYDTREPFGANFHLRDGTQGPGRHNSLPFSSQYGPPNLEKHGGYLSIPVGTHMASSQAHRSYIGQPPLPPSPPPPLPAEPPGHLLFEAHALSSPPKTSSSLFPIHVSSSATPPSSYAAVPEAQSMRQTYYSNKLRLRDSTGFVNEELQANHQESSKKFLGESQPFPFRHPSSDKPTVVDASHIFKHPHRATRPDHIVVILRGLPGSGKSYLAKMLRDLEVENGANAPRIHSMDEYFMTEVEKVDDTDSARSSASARGKRPVMKKVMEYCYEPEMEEAYRSSMLKTFKKTLDEGVFSFVIVDDRNLRVADFAQFWATAKRSGYEVYLLEAAYMDPAGCAAKNVHGFTLNDIQKMAEQWEEAPSLYLKLDIKPLLHRDDLEENGIQEVDMDTEDGEPAGGASGLEDRNLEVIGRPMHDVVPNDTLKNDERYDAEEDHQTEEIKELRSSKWSNDLDEDDVQGVERTKGNLSSLSGLIQAYGKDGKSIHWGDQGVNRGFSIGGANKANVLSLVIGPGAGYNLKSNPLPEGEEKLMSTPNGGESKHRNMFQERLRAERESFRAVFDKRKHRIGGLGLEEE